MPDAQGIPNKQALIAILGESPAGREGRLRPWRQGLEALPGALVMSLTPLGPGFSPRGDVKILPRDHGKVSTR